MSRTLILTCCGGRMMPTLLDALRAQAPSRALWGVDARGAEVPAETRALLARFETAPTPDAADFADALLEIAAAAAPALLVAGADEEAEALAPHRARFEARGVLLNVSPPEAIARIRDKAALLPADGSLGRVAAPESFEPTLRALGYPDRPVILKPRTGRGRRGVYRIVETPGPAPDDVVPEIAPETAKAVLAESPAESQLLMRFLHGPALTCDLLADCGRLVYATCRTWVAPWRFPFPGQRVGPNPATNAIAHWATERFGLHGLVDLDVIDDATLGPTLLEVNPRPSGSMAAAVLAGVPLIEDLERVLAQETVATPEKALQAVWDIGPDFVARPAA